MCCTSGVGEVCRLPSRLSSSGGRRIRCVRFRVCMCMSMSMSTSMSMSVWEETKKTTGLNSITPASAPRRASRHHPSRGLECGGLWRLWRLWRGGVVDPGNANSGVQITGGGFCVCHDMYPRTFLRKCHGVGKGRWKERAPVAPPVFFFFLGHVHSGTACNLVTAQPDHRCSLRPLRAMVNSNEKTRGSDHPSIHLPGSLLDPRPTIPNMDFARVPRRVSPPSPCRRPSPPSPPPSPPHLPPTPMPRHCVCHCSCGSTAATCSWSHVAAQQGPAVTGITDPSCARLCNGQPSRRRRREPSTRGVPGIDRVVF